LTLIPRLNLGSDRPRFYTWPKDLPDHKARSPFQMRPALRHLRVLVDDDAISVSEADPYSQAGVLAGLLADEHVISCRYGDAGPPPGIPVDCVPGLGEAPRGWVAMAHRIDIDADNWHQAVRWGDGRTVHIGDFHPSNADIIARDTSTGAYADLSTEEAAAQRQRDGIAVGVAYAFGADLYITEREHLHQTNRKRNTFTVLTVSEGLAFVSLYLRAQGVYLVWSDPTGKWRTHIGQSMFFWVGTRELLPAAWRWVAACAQHGQHVQDYQLRGLALSALQRVQRALQARDAVHRALNQPHTTNIGDDAVANFETTLLLLMAAMDLTAVVAHKVLGLTGSSRYASWQHPGWLSQARAKSVDLASAVDQGTPDRNALTILTNLRNAIHGEAPLDVKSRQAGDRSYRTMMSLRTTRHAEVLAAMECLGGSAIWGARPSTGDEILADPGLLLERLFPRITDLLDKLMRLTPVEHLLGVKLQPSDLQPPGGAAISEMFGEPQRLSIRWQLGF
jgi:hypothetical protein